MLNSWSEGLLRPRTFRRRLVTNDHCAFPYLPYGGDATTGTGHRAQGTGRQVETACVVNPQQYLGPAEKSHIGLRETGKVSA